MTRRSLTLGSALWLAVLSTVACAPGARDPTPPPGSHEMLRASIEAAPGLEVVLSDVVIPPDATAPSHAHPGEELVYVLSGSAVHMEEGKPDRLVKAGEALRIAPGVVHAPRGGPEGARAIVFRVHVQGAPERARVAE